MKNIKNFIMCIVFIAILIMAVGYSTFATQINLNGTANIIGEWDVRITNIEAKDISEGCDAGNPQYTNTSAIFDAKLEKPGDSLTYVITIQNAGTIDATLNNIVCKEDDEGSPAIIYTTTEIANSLKAGEQTQFEVKIQYDPNIIEIPSIKTKTIMAIIEYVQE